MRLFFPACFAILLLLTAHAGAGGTVEFQTAINGAVGGVVNLDGGTTYTGPANIISNVVVNGNGATIDLDQSAASFRTIHVGVGRTLTLNNATVTGGTITFQCQADSTLMLTNVIVTDSENNCITHNGGTGRIILTDCTFTNHEFGINADFRSSPFVAGVPHVQATNTSFTNNKFPIYLKGGYFWVEGCSFSGGQQCIVAENGTGTASNRSRMNNCQAANAQFFALDLQQGGFVEINGGTFTNLDTVINMKDGADVRIDGAIMDSTGLLSPGVGISMLNECRLEIRNSTMIRHLNSIQAIDDCFILAEDSTFSKPWFSGIILLDNSEMELRRCDFLDNGQDGIFAGSDVNGIPSRPARGLVEDCFVSNAGADEPNPNVGLTSRAGTGIAFFSGDFTLRRCIVVDSFDTGLAFLEEANVLIEDCEILFNRLSGVGVVDCDIEIRNSLVAGHTRFDAGGVTRNTASSLSLDIHGTAIVNNTYGLLKATTSAPNLLTDSLIARSGKQGISSTTGAVFTGRRLALLDTQEDYAVFLQNGGQSTLSDSTLWGTNWRGLFASDSPAPDARNCFWGAAGPIDTSSQNNPGGRMGYQNAQVSPFRTTPPVEAFYHADTNSILSAGEDPWLELSAPSAAIPARSIFSAVRFDQSASPGYVLPSGVVDQRPMRIWTSYVFRQMDGDAVVRIASQNASAARQLARINPSTGAVLDMIAVVPAGAYAEATTTANRFVSGVWVLTGDTVVLDVIDRLTGRSNGGSDRNGDSIIDAADVVAP